MIIDLHDDKFFGSPMFDDQASRRANICETDLGSYIEIHKTIFLNKSYFSFHHNGIYIARVLITKNIGMTDFVVRDKTGILGYATTREDFFRRVCGVSKEFQTLLLWNKI